ncbi:DUF1573 domain-containing protein [Winogradskyella sp. 4-2091]|uniref:DUF1573 domain-containing protein n=1 Tax=Winogradskyella sp. 4-2091 TaxID=3381659 RepID=UPI003891B036
MKKILLFTYLFCITLTIGAQDLISKIPKDAKAVIAIKGKNVTDLVSVAEFENSKIGKVFLKEMIKETDGQVSNLNELGFDLKRSFYYFMTSDSLSLKHNFLVPLKDKSGFEKLMPEREKKNVITEGDLSYFVDSYDNMVMMWNDNVLLFTLSQETYTNDYYGYNDYSIEEAVVEDVVDEAYSYPVMEFAENHHDFGVISQGSEVSHSFKFTNTGDADLVITDARASCGCTVPEYPVTAMSPGESGEIIVKFNSKSRSGSQYKTITLTTNAENGVEKLTIDSFVSDDETVIEETEVEEIVMESAEVEIEETVIESTEYEPSSYNDDYYENLRKEREAKKLISDKALIAYAKATMQANYANGSILKNTKYVKAVGNGKDEATAWIGDLSSIYSDILQQASYGLGSDYLGLYNGFQKFYGDMSLSSKLNFEKNHVSLKTNYTMNNEMAKYTEAMYNGKMNSNFFKYFNEDKMLGYFSVNMSTKGILEAYPEMMSKMFEGYDDNEVAEFLPIGMDILSLLLDEEGAAKILRGDMLFVLTEMKERELTYTTYEYDENYEREEVTKTKKETLPGFLMMVTSSEGDLFHKLMKIAVKESRGEVTLNANGIYQLNTNELPFALNVMFKDDAILLGTSFEDMVAIKTGKFDSKVSGKHKSLIKKNSSAIYVNGKEIAATFPREIMPNDFKERIDFIAENTEDVIFKTGKVKNNAMEGEMILNTPEKGNSNSLAYFLNMINALMD